MTWGPITFAAPLALWALAALPLLFFILRATPPAPQRRAFPPLRLLLGLQTDEQSRERAPLWLVLLRALMCALAIIGFARPSLTPEAAAEAQTRGGRTLIVIDDGWTSAPFWAQARAAALDAIAEAERGGGQIFILHTAPARMPRDPGEAFTPGEARGHFNALEPSPWRVDRAEAAERIQSVPGRFDRILWIADGLDDDRLSEGGARALAAALAAKGPTTARLPARTARAVVAASVGADGVTAELRRAQTGADAGAVTAETAEGRSLGAAEFRFAGETAIARIDLPPEIAARTARVRIVGEDSAGAVRLMPGGAARPSVGLVDPGAQGQPLLSDLFYVDRALSPYASLRRGDVNDLVRRRVQAMVLADASRIAPADRDALTRWIERGGVLIRFAGPRLANDADDLLPVRLRPGARTIGGALAWERPQQLRPFAANSPFAGLAIPEDVAVRWQVLAEPSAETESRVWARLEDGAPIVTAQAQGRGLIVLYHVTAGPAWSDLPLSGLYVEMLRRTIAFAGRGGEAEERPDASGPYVASRLMDGFGALSPADAEAATIAAEAFASTRAGPAAPPGFYERAGIPATLDAAHADERLAPLPLPASIARAGLESARVRPLTGLFLGAAAALLALDLLLSLWLAGRLPRLARAGGAAALVLLAALATAPRAFAQGDPTLELHLAYVRTGDAATDRIARQGLEALTETLRARTTVEPDAPIGVDLARDDLSVFPFIYWPAPPAPRPLSNEAVANLDRYLRLGGMLLVDTRDAGRRAGGDRGPAAIMLAGLDAPPLEPIGAEHVLARSFYLLRAFPGRASAPRLWGESPGAASARDGVASLFVGDGDWAAAWASNGGAGLSGGARQHELALRFGVNLVMVALTGNYKEDQVHVPALLERLGRERR